MQLKCVCPECHQRVDAVLDEASPSIVCSVCGWKRPVCEGDVVDGQPVKCVVCGCGDLWRQKNFPQALGLAMVAAGALLSTVAWSFYMPQTALGVLLAFALVDVLLYTFMRDILVCYRCRARYSDTSLHDDQPRFNLETAERYRQEAARVANAQPPPIAR